MKKLIRKLSLHKLRKESFRGITKHYIVVYDNSYSLLSEAELERQLLKPKKGKEIQFIFNWEDRLEIRSVFENV